jgi:hypothetical protein
MRQFELDFIAASSGLDPSSSLSRPSQGHCQCIQEGLGAVKAQNSVSDLDHQAGVFNDSVGKKQMKFGFGRFIRPAETTASELNYGSVS